MPTHTLLNGLSGNLESSTSWTQQQALELIQQNVVQAMSSLTPEETLRYLAAERKALQAMATAEQACSKIAEDFKTQGLEQLRDKIGGRDPEQYFIYTTYMEQLEQPFPWDPRPSETSPHIGETSPRLRRRTYEDWKYKEHVKHMSLWEAACLNFGFTHSIPQDSGFSLVEASKVIGPNGDQSLTTQSFINAARELDLGEQLRKRYLAALDSAGNLRSLTTTATRASLEFELLDAYRNRASSGITRELYDKISATLTDKGPQLPIDTLSLTPGKTLIVAVPIVPWESHIPIPLLLIRVAALGVVSYFPLRPGGAFLYHVDASAAHAAFRDQLLDSHKKQDLGWFSRQLPLIGLSVFDSLLSKEQRPKNLSWLAGVLYDGFHKAFSKPTLEKIHFTTDIKSGRPETLLQAATYRHIQRYQANLQVLATSKSDADWQALKDGAAAIASEILQLLLTPLPGGVTGVNRLMLVSVMGSLTYAFAQGLNEAFRGDPSGFASTLADVADMAVSGRLISTAGRVHRQRMRQYLAKLGNPRKVTCPNGAHELWKPDASPYAHANQKLLDDKTANALGIYSIEGAYFVKLRQDDQTLVTQVTADHQHERYMLKHSNGSAYTPPIIFVPSLQAWQFDLQNAHTLSDRQLLQRMLPNGTPRIPDADLEQMLSSTSTTRTILDKVWNAEPAPLNLTEGVKRLQIDRVIRQITDQFHQPGNWPNHGDAAIFCLLTQLPNWPVDSLLNIYDPQGNLIASYGKTEQPPAHPQSVRLSRQDDGGYIGSDNLARAPDINEHLLQLIVRQQPATSLLGKDDRPTHSENERINLIRTQISALARRERYTLFSAMFSYAGYEKSELITEPVMRQFLAVKTTPLLIPLTPLLKKLRNLNPPLSTANLEQIIQGNPLTARQQEAFLAGGTLPIAFSQLLENHRTALRIDAAIDGLYHSRRFNQDVDLWAREFGSALVRTKLNRPFVITEVVAGNIAKPYVSTGPNDLTVELRHYGAGHYEAYDMRNAGTIAVTPLVDSFYLAIGSVLQPHERQLLGMNSASDAKGLRKTLGDYMSAQRSPEGFVSLVNGSLMQYEQSLSLPAELKPRADGVFEFNAEQYLPLFGALYRITFDKNRRKWRLKHPEKIGVDTPLLEHNGTGAWRLASENPMTWDDYSLFQRLGHTDYGFPQDTAKNILALTDTSAQVLRQVHSTAREAPPLLVDTCKRFKIEQQLNQFIEGMRTGPSSNNARPDLQLLIVSALPGWPDNHALQVVDSHNRVIKQYPAGNTRAQKVMIQERHHREGQLLDTLAQNAEVTRALLGELPESINERVFKLVKKVLLYAQQEKTQLFDSLYTLSESAGGDLQKTFKTHHPELPNSTINAILGLATPRELKQLHEQKKPGLRLREQALLSAHDLRLNRAYEGLFLEGVANSDSDKITLHLLKSLPAWPAGIVFEVREQRFSGRKIGTGGDPSGTQRYVLVEAGQRYLAYDSQGVALGEPDSRAGHLLPAIVQTLSDSQINALGVTDIEDLSPLRNQIAQLALEKRIEIKRLLDLPHVQPWLQPPMRVDRTFTTYPLWSMLWPFGGNRARDLTAKVQELYPSFNNDDARRFIRSLDLSEPATLIELDRRQAEYRAMDTQLTLWSDTGQPIDNVATDPLGMNIGRRRHIANQLRRAWRRDDPQVYVTGLFEVHSLALQLGGNDLPPASFLEGTSGFAHIEHLIITAERFPANGNAFLGKFSGLIALKLDCVLTELPRAVTEMTELRQLDLCGNDIVLNQDSVQRLATMTQLDYLNMNDNPLGLTPDVTRMTRLSLLDLRGTGISQWPVGAEGLNDLDSLLLQENQITEIPEQVFTHPGAQVRNRNTLLHENPLTDETRQRIAQYRTSTGITLGGALPGITHQPASQRSVNPWLVTLQPVQQREATELWASLLNHEGARPDDVFRVLADLTKSADYLTGGKALKNLTERVWALLRGLSESTQLREKVFLNTYVAGTCGDGATLAFNNMELMHLTHQTLSRYNEVQIERELLDLAKRVYYLERVDQFSDNLINQLSAANRSPDPAEVTLFFRVKLAHEFNLPVHEDQMLYSVTEHVSDNDMQQARKVLLALNESSELVGSYKMRDFWIEYLERTYPEPFLTVKDVTNYKIELLRREIPNKSSDEYLDRLQALYDLNISERNRLIRQLTEATLLALQRS